MVRSRHKLVSEIQAKESIRDVKYVSVLAGSLTPLDTLQVPAQRNHVRCGAEALRPRL